MMILNPEMEIQIAEMLYNNYWTQEALQCLFSNSA